MPQARRRRSSAAGWPSVRSTSLSRWSWRRREQLTKVVHLARELGVPAPVTLQPQYSLLVREIEWEIVPAALDARLGLLPWSPLGGGWLLGKYRRDQRPSDGSRLGDDPGRGMEAWDRRGTDRTWDVIDAVQQIADGRGVSMTEVGDYPYGTLGVEQRSRDLSDGR